MENFIKISKEEAEQIGRFEYKPNHVFDPFVGEQKDGSYLIEDKMIEILKEHENFKKIDIQSKELVEKQELEFKLFEK